MKPSAVKPSYLPWIGFWISFTVISMMSVAKYFALHSSLLDLGSFLFNFHNVAAGNWQRLFINHVQPLMALWALQYHLLPPELVPYTTVVAQAAILAIPVILLFRHYGWLPALVYGLYSPLWYNALFDFHIDHLSVILLFGFFMMEKKGQIWVAVLLAMILTLVKEPFALQTAACGVYLLWPRRQYAAGAVLVIFGLSYFFFATHYLIPYFSGGARVGFDSGAFSWLGRSIGEMILTLLTHPLEILRDILGTPGKLTYLFFVFGLLAFIPLLAPSYLIPTLPLLAIAMLSHLANYYDYNTHYTAGLIIPVIFAFIHGLPKAHALWMRGAKWVWRKASGVKTALLTRVVIIPHPQGERGYGVCTVMEARLSKVFYVLLALWILGGHVMLSPSPISRLFWSDKVWSYSWRAYVPTEREAMMKEAMLKYIPADPEVSVTTQNTVNWYHLAHRKVHASFPQGIEELIQVMDRSGRMREGFWRFVRTGKMSPTVTHDLYADYIVLDLKRPWFISDRGCEWIYGECLDKEKAREFFDLVARTKAQYEVLFERDGFMIFKKR